MSNSKLEARPALFGAKAAAAQNTQIEVIEDWTIAHVAERKGQGSALRARINDLFGIELPETPRVVSSAGVSAVWAGPGQWLIVAEVINGRDLERELQTPLAGLAAVNDQTDSRAVVRVSGPNARHALAKGVSIDLHPKVFKAGDAAITQASHIGVTIWRPVDSDGFILTCASSYAGSFWHWLTDACQATGLTVR